MKRIIAIIILLWYFIVIVIALFPTRNTTIDKNILNINPDYIIDYLIIPTVTPKIKIKTYSKYKIGWLNNNANVRDCPTLDSNIYEVFLFGQEVSFYQYNKEWCVIKYKNSIAYIYSELISECPTNYHEFEVDDQSIKSFMPFKSITSKSSNQYQLQQIAYTGKYGIRQVNNRYCIAIGSYFTTEIGTYIDVILQNGTIIPCILADCKADKDTNTMNVKTLHDGSLIEFIVNMEGLSKKSLITGDISFSCTEWNSPVVKIKVYDKTENY